MTTALMTGFVLLLLAAALVASVVCCVEEFVDWLGHRRRMRANNDAAAAEWTDLRDTVDRIRADLDALPLIERVAHDQTALLLAEIEAHLSEVAE